MCKRITSSALALWALCFGIAVAAPAVVSTGKAAAACSTTATLSATPANGSVVAAALFNTSFTTGNPNIRDSNNVTLGGALGGTNGTKIKESFYTVTGSPTATYTFNATAGTCQDEVAINISNAVFNVQSFAGSGGSSLVAAAAGDIITCAVNYTTTLGNATLSMTNVGTITTVVNDTTNDQLYGYATATAPGTTTCTATGGTGLTINNSGIVDFKNPTATSVGCPPNPYPCAMRPA